MYSCIAVYNPVVIYNTCTAVQAAATSYFKKTLTKKELRAQEKAKLANKDTGAAQPKKEGGWFRAAAKENKEEPNSLEANTEGEGETPKKKTGLWGKVQAGVKGMFHQGRANKEDDKNSLKARKAAAAQKKPALEDIGGFEI